MLLSGLGRLGGRVRPAQGVFLWGFAVVLLHPLAEARQTQRANEWGAFGPSGIGDPELMGLILVYVAILSVFAVVFTVAAAIGAGLRLLWWRLRGEPALARLGLTSGNNDAA